MKQTALYILLTLISIYAISQKHTFSIVNPLPIERHNELVLLERAAIEKYVGTIADDYHYEISSTNKAISYQSVDLNNDDNWDQLVFLCSFLASEKKSFVIAPVINQKFVREDTSKPLAHVRMKPKNADNIFGESITSATMPYQNLPNDFSKNPLPPYLTEGPAWENDKVAFRLYFDTRNTIDIYGKLVKGMVMDTVGDNIRSNYHNLSGWGMDILHVVKSLGAGSLAIATQDENGRDTLIRLGGKNILKETYQQLADGPLYAAFEMNYEWKINDKPVAVKQQFSFWGGQYFYESKVTITGAPQGSKLACGIADFYENTVDSLHSTNTAALLSHGRQSEHKDELGMAIMFPQKSFAYLSEAPKGNSDVMETHLAAQNIINDQPLTFRFYSCWSMTDEKFVSKNYFKQFIQKETEKVGDPLIIKWNK